MKNIIIPLLRFVNLAKFPELLTIDGYTGKFLKANKRISLLLMR